MAGTKGRMNRHTSGSKRQAVSSSGNGVPNVVTFGNRSRGTPPRPTGRTQVAAVAGPTPTTPPPSVFPQPGAPYPTAPTGPNFMMTAPTGTSFNMPPAPSQPNEMVLPGVQQPVVVQQPAIVQQPEIVQPTGNHPIQPVSVPAPQKSPRFGVGVRTPRPPTTPTAAFSPSEYTEQTVLSEIEAETVHDDLAGEHKLEINDDDL